MQNIKLLYSLAKSMDLVDYLTVLGYDPKKIRNNDYWYLSPFRKEADCSFKVNCALNVWYDHGMGKGGNLVEFGKTYFNCNALEFLGRLESQELANFLFHNSVVHHQNQISEKDREAKIIVTDCRQITDPSLRQYLYNRNIPLVIANRFCSEIEFELYGNRNTAIGFKNNSGGYELRSESFKGSSSPKDITTIENNASAISVFEGFFDFLSFQTQTLSDRNRIHVLPKVQDSYIVLNSLAFINQSLELLRGFQHVNLYLDRDDAGMRITSNITKQLENSEDQSLLYEHHKDLNDYHIHRKKIEVENSKRFRHGL